MCHHIEFAFGVTVAEAYKFQQFTTIYLYSCFLIPVGYRGQNLIYRNKVRLFGFKPWMFSVRENPDVRPEQRLLSVVGALTPRLP